MGVSEDFCKGARKEIELFAAWPPGEPIRVGDYGRVNDYRFSRSSNVAHLEAWPDDISLAPRPPRAVSTAVWGSDSSNVFEVAAGYKPDDDSPVLVSGGLRMKFEEKNSFAVNLGQAKIVSLENSDKVMWELHRRAHLDEDDPLYWHHSRDRVVTKIMTCERFAYALSRQSDSAISLELSVNGESTAIGSAEASMRWGQQAKSVVTWEGSGHATAFIELWHVYREPLGSGIRVTDK